MIYVATLESSPAVCTGSEVVYNLHVHSILVSKYRRTKYRRGALTDAMLKRCEEIMRDVCSDFEAEFNGEAADARALRRYAPPNFP